MSRRKQKATRYRIAGSQEALPLAGGSVAVFGNLPEGRINLRVKPGDASFVEAVRRIGQGIVANLADTVIDLNMTTNPQEVRALRAANRGAHSGPSKLIGVKVKTDAYESIERRADELGVSVSEYVRALIATDIGVIA